jgi:hypothetical protein
MIDEEEQRSDESGAPDRLAGHDEPPSVVRADPLAEELTGAEFEAAWAGLGAQAATAIAEELARVAAREREPPRRRASRSPPPSAAKTPQSLPPIPAAKLESPAIVVVETESGEPDLLALSRSYVPSTPAASVSLPAVVPQVVTIVQQVPPRSTIERKLLLTLVVLLVAVNGYFLATRERPAAPDPARAAELRSPEPASAAPAANETMQVRPAAALPPTPTPTAPIAIPAPAPQPQPDAPSEAPLVIGVDAAVEPAVPTSPPRAAARPRKPKTKPSRADALPDKPPPVAPPKPSPVEEPAPPKREPPGADEPG